MASALRPDKAGEHPVYAAAGGNRVTIELSRDETGGTLDVVEVLAQPGGGPHPTDIISVSGFSSARDSSPFARGDGGTVVPTRALGLGDSVWVPPWTVHGTLNLSDEVARFQVVGQPGLMSGYFPEAGVLVSTEETSPPRQPAGPDALGEIAARWGIKFWNGPVATNARP